MGDFSRKMLAQLGTIPLSYALWTHPLAAEDSWTRFRGPNGSGVSSESTPSPTTWSTTENLKWKASLPGPGSSSPIVVGNKVFVTCWSGYGVNPNEEGDPQNLKRHLICVDKGTGKILWDQSVAASLPEDDYGGMFAEHGYASHTPVSDGKNVYVFFGKSGVLAFDLNGNQLWRTKVGDGLDARRWGSACSPILYNNTLIVTAAAESQAIIGLDKDSGKELWRAEAEGLASTWGTPVLTQNDEGKTQLVLGVPYELWGLDPETGKLSWYCEAMDSDSYCSSVIEHAGIIYAIEGRGGGSIAVKAGGKKDISQTNVLWRGRNNNRISTPIYYDNRIYFFSGRIANCIDAKTGAEIFQGRLPAANTTSPTTPVGGTGGRRAGSGGRGGQDYGSPILADGKIYFITRNGDMHVLKATDQLESLAVNRVTNDPEDFSATPAISGGELFVRSNKHMYCISTKN